ncbi:MAG: hypothetical protein AAFV86_09660 [Pseudomonadota bacterium]
MASPDATQQRRPANGRNRGIGPGRGDATGPSPDPAAAAISGRALGADGPQGGTTAPPRFATYPTLDRFLPLEGSEAAGWLAEVPAPGPIELYLHVPFCAELCAFCICRAERARNAAALDAFLATLLAEIDLVAGALPAGVETARLHLGGGSPAILGAARLARLAGRLASALPGAPGCERVVETALADLDTAALEAIAAFGATRAVLGLGEAAAGAGGTWLRRGRGRAGARQTGPVGDVVSESADAAIADALAALAEAGVGDVTIELLVGLPGAPVAALARAAAAAAAAGAGRIVLAPYLQRPDIARRQRGIPAALMPLPGEAEEARGRARRALRRAGYRRLGVDTWIRPGDTLGQAAAAGVVGWGFAGLVPRVAPAIVALGPSAVSRLPGGYLQNGATIPAWSRAVDRGRLPAWRGHGLGPGDRLRRAAIEALIAAGTLDLEVLGAQAARSREAAAFELELATLAEALRHAARGLDPRAVDAWTDRALPAIVLSDAGMDEAHGLAAAIAAAPHATPPVWPVPPDASPGSFWADAGSL